MKHLKEPLDDLLDGVDWPSHREADPISIVWRYERDEDREVVALIAATLAYGQVALLKGAIERVLVHLGPYPAQALQTLTLDDHNEALEDFVYRMTRAEDVAHLFVAIGSALEAHGTLLDLFNLGYNDADDDFQSALGDFVHDLRARGESTRRGFLYLLADPRKGGSCKRLNLFLRWMVRGPDEIDLGLWSTLPSHKLVMPLDTHVLRICRNLGLARRKTPDWRLAREIRDALCTLDPVDPLRYDFAICHLGISGQCPSKRDPDICDDCGIRDFCVVS